MPARKTPYNEVHVPRKSRRVQRLAPEIYSLAKIPYLPTEIRFAILQYVEKKDLKQVRLASKEWSSLAMTPLFDTINISPHEEDVRVFKAITSHPVISKGVKRLVYDTATFRSDWSCKDYCRELYWQTIHIANRWNRRPFRGGDTQMIDFIEQRKGILGKLSQDEINDHEIRRLPKHHNFVVEGYQKYKENATYERRVLKKRNILFRSMCGTASLK